MTEEEYFNLMDWLWGFIPPESVSQQPITKEVAEFLEMIYTSD